MAGSTQCEHCGGPGPCVPTYRGVQQWDACKRCVALVQEFERTGRRPEHPFGVPAQHLPPPTTTKEGWASYRIACQELGYTLFTAHDLDEHRALHAAWGRWMAYVVRMRVAAGDLRDRPKQSLFFGRFVPHLEEVYPVSPASPPLDRFVAAMIGKRPLRAAPHRRIVSHDIPPRGALRHG